MKDRPALHPSAPVGEALREVARDALIEARTAIEAAAKSDAERVHGFRRAMKRWRALLRLLEPFVGQGARRLRDEGRDLARALSGARDAQSALDALADLEKHGLIGALNRRTAATDRSHPKSGRNYARCRHAPATRQRARSSGRDGRPLAAFRRDLR
jgi:CHAD domain-containing protein